MSLATEAFRSCHISQSKPATLAPWPECVHPQLGDFVLESTDCSVDALISWTATGEGSPPRILDDAGNATDFLDFVNRHLTIRHPAWGEHLLVLGGPEERDFYLLTECLCADSPDDVARLQPVFRLLENGTVSQPNPPDREIPIPGVADWIVRPWNAADPRNAGLPRHEVVPACVL